MLHHAFINRPATNKILRQKYKTPENLIGMSYDTVRAAAALAAELQPVPDPVALMAHLSCANHIFRRWSCYLYDKSKRTDDELDATCYTRDTAKKDHLAMSIEYDLCSLAGVYRPSWSKDSLVRKLRTAYYGALVAECQIGARITTPFDPLEEVRAALENQGYYPSKKIAGDLLPDPPALPSNASSNDDDEDLAVEIGELLEESLAYDDADEVSDDDASSGDDERSEAGSISGDDSESDEDDCQE